MASRVIEYGGVDRQDGFTAVPENNKVTAQTAITATATPASSPAFSSRTCLVAVNTDEAIYVAFGTAPTATTNDYRIPAGNTVFFAVQPGASWKVSVRT